MVIRKGVEPLSQGLETVLRIALRPVKYCASYTKLPKTLCLDRLTNGPYSKISIQFYVLLVTVTLMASFVPNKTLLCNKFAVSNYTYHVSCLF